MVSERDRQFWATVRRALLMIVSAIDAYLGNGEAVARSRYTRVEQGSETRPQGRPRA